MKMPVATYRIQFNKGFTFEQLEGIIDYLHALGISTIYASPITSAQEGSLHGYDVIDPHHCNPEIGPVGTLTRIAGKLRAKGMGWLQDIVPNHMAYSSGNKRLMDVLERGRFSPFYTYFDIQGNHPAFPGKLMAPFLPDNLPVCIRKKEVRLQLSENGVLVACPGGNYPLSLCAYHLLFIDLMARDTAMMIPPPLTHLALVCLQTRDYEQWQHVKRSVFGEVLKNARYRQQAEALLSLVNNREAWLREVLDKQYYKLCSWWLVSRVINYRRFFTVSSLICLKMEQEAVFNDYHSFFLQLYRTGIIQGLRIDHIDGLYDPGEYIYRLRQLFGDDCYIIVEKILASKEYLPAGWPLQGTSGYEFLAYVSQLLTRQEGVQELHRFYHELAPGMPDYHQVVLKSKQLILQKHMVGELDNLLRLFFEYELQQHDDIDRWRTALCAFMVHLPVYRLYPDRYPLTEEDRHLLHESFVAAKLHAPASGLELDYLQRLFTGLTADCELAPKVVHFLKRLMQFTGPLMAKGVEDTTFYVYNPLIAHNEVGDTPAMAGMPVEVFHATMENRLRTTPFALNATSTHDTKRGEDARMRLNVLAEIPHAWKQATLEWFMVNQRLHVALNGKEAPDLNEEYFIYQSLLAGFPASLECTPAFIKRLQEYTVKALREAKVNSNWDTPNTDYEEACSHFIQQILRADHCFLTLFLPLAKKVVALAAVYSLSQVLIKFTAPGIPDVYQGCELWDLSFADPDNRRPVDYKRACACLQQLRELEKKGMRTLLQYVQDHRSEGLEKLYVTWKTLQWRGGHADLFVKGDYYPLTITGDTPAAMAYARALDDQWVIAVVPLHLAHQPDERAQQQLLLPAQAAGSWKNIFTGATMNTATGGYLHLPAVLADFPVALLVGD